MFTFLHLEGTTDMPHERVFAFTRLVIRNGGADFGSSDITDGVKFFGKLKLLAFLETFIRLSQLSPNRPSFLCTPISLCRGQVIMKQ